jgi:hypothetical protein
LWEEDDFAVCVVGKDCVNVGCVIGDAVAVDRKAGDGFDIDELVKGVLLIGGRGHGEVFAVLKQV